MDTFVDSSWYFFRYCDPQNPKEPFDRKAIKEWFPIDLYIGGIEHAILHLIYSRFWTKMMRDLGLISLDEPIVNLFHLGMVLKDGAVMSKSKGNVVDPDEIISNFGADTARMFILFSAPPEKELDWSEEAVEGMFKFLQRVFRLVAQHVDSLKNAPGVGEIDEFSQRAKVLRRAVHQTVRQVTLDLEQRMHFNTSVAALMKLVNEMYQVDDETLKEESVQAAFYEAAEAVIKMLSIFAPHISEEMWEMIGNANRLTYEPWPKFDEALAAEEEIEIPVQINGKVRARILVPPEIEEEELRKVALRDSKVQSWIGERSVVKFVIVPKRLVNIVIK